MLTTLYKMHNTLCPQYLDTCLPPTASHISDHNLRNDENYATPTNNLIMSTTFFIPSTVWSLTKLDLNIINSLNISCLNLGLNKNTIKSPKYLKIQFII